MKKIFLLFLLCAMSFQTYAAKRPIPETEPRSVMLARAGDSYYVGNEKMGKLQTLRWLKAQDCRVAYDLFRSGYETAMVGWGLLGLGAVLDVAGSIYMVVSIDNGAPRGLVAGYMLYSLGGALELAAVPTISVGYWKMHQTPKTYNTHCYRSADARPYWAIQAGTNGLGVAYKF